ncbi:ATP-binding protein [Breoghania sp. L-A4]|uniref:ATP-binding protein n=1 Tax=Breoghania sp. L-A4 TaxID=2304600 RepID=UPI000E35C2C8|nr:ATP-binding protein [Breoghania sp. L-A4]AXS38824.1 ATP-binding protein [Breoghania sp. L-A4]
MKVSIDIGTTSTAEPAVMDLEELLATRLLVQGNSGSGKSHLLRRILEQSATWVQQAIIDPEGDFVTLAERFGHVVVDANGATERDLTRIAGRVRQHRISVVLNLEGLDADVQMKAAAAFLNGLFEAERDHWYPMLVVVDEAQLFAPAVGGEVSEEARRVSLGAMTNLMCRGRKRGLAGVIATQRLAKLAKNVAAEAANFLMGRTFLDIDMARAADLLGMERRQAEAFRNLTRGNFIALGSAISRRPVQVTIGDVETSARSGSPKLMPLPEQPPADAKDLIFTPGEDEVEPVVRTAHRRSAPQPAPDLLAQLAQARPLTVETETPAGPAMPEEERSAAIDAIVREILDDPEAAFRPIALLYQDFLVRLRIGRLPGDPPDLSAFRQRLAVARAGVDTGSADVGSEWSKALDLAQHLPDDMQGVFLVVARAAMEGAPCPPDGEIARIYGTRSTGRARRLLTYMEERNFIVCSDDLSGTRIIALPELGWKTGSGASSARRAGPARPVDPLFAELRDMKTASAPEGLAGSDAQSAERRDEPHASALVDDRSESGLFDNPAPVLSGAPADEADERDLLSHAPARTRTEDSSVN